jgi:beta-lactam-binding protein with PASTA domain
VIRVTTRVSDPLVGRLLDGRYRVDERVARGGMATVYVGLDTRLDRPVAIKVMHVQYAEDAEFVARFGREARSAARLNHPCVVSVYDQGEDAGFVFLVMEYVPGRTLRDLLNERGRLSAAESLDLMEPVLAALSAAHAAGIVHRDVKPENVLLADDGRVKVADFGLARAFSGAAGSATKTQGVILGTMAYLSPEQVEHGHADARSDVYSVGVMLYELLTGTLPFTGDSPINVAFRHVNEDVPPPSRLVPSIHPAVDALVERATRRRPEERPQDAGRLLSAVREVRRTVPAAALGPAAAPLADQQTIVLNAQRVSHPTTAEPVASTPRKGPGAVGGVNDIPRAARRRRRWWLVPIVLLLLVGLGVGAGYAAWWETTGQWVRTPSVLNLDRSAAAAKLTKAHLTASFGPAAFSETYAKGAVSSMDPGAGSRLHKGATVTLVVSKGPERFATPKLVGQTVSQARGALGKVNLSLGKQTPRYDDAVPSGQIISQSKASGTPLAKGSSVDIVVSRGPRPIKVPDLRGGSVDEVAGQLSSLGLSPKVNEVYSDTVPAGQVMDQVPHDKTLLPGGSVTLTVSRGPQLFQVPGVRGKTFGEAKQILEAAGFRVERRDLIGSFLNRVYAQSPGAGSMQPRDTVITLTIV